MKIKREVKLALTAIVAVVILVWGVNYLKGISFFERSKIYYSVYDRVEGLKISSGVQFRGYQVGQVLSISFIGERNDKVLVKFSIKEDMKLAKNSCAMIQSDDLMGTKIINIIPGDSDEPAQRGDTLRSTIEQGLMEQVSSQLLPLKQKAEQMMSSVDSVLTIVQGLFDERTKESLSNSFLSIGRTLDHIEVASESLDTLLRNEATMISQILSNLNSITTNLRDNNGEVTTILENFSALSDSLQQANLKQLLFDIDILVNNISDVVASINEGEGTLGSLVSDDDLYHNLDMTIENLNRLLVEFRYNPKRFINLSLINLSSKKNGSEEYGIVIHESQTPLNINSEIFTENPRLKEIKYKGQYLYIIDSYKRLKQAKRRLESVIERYNNAYIIKIDFM